MESQQSLNWDIVNDSISKNANLGSMESSKPQQRRIAEWLKTNPIFEESAEESIE